MSLNNPIHERRWGRKCLIKPGTHSGQVAYVKGDIRVDGRVQFRSDCGTYTPWKGAIIREIRDERLFLEMW